MNSESPDSEQIRLDDGLAVFKSLQRRLLCYDGERDQTMRLVH